MNLKWMKFKEAILHPIREGEIRRAMELSLTGHPDCACCNQPRDPVSGKKNQVHHRIPRHIRPDLAADPENFITLCRWCHFWIGHLGNWQDWNKNLEKSIFYVRQALQIWGISGMVRDWKF